MSKFYLTAVVIIFLSISLTQILFRASLIKEVKTVEPSYIAYVTAQACKQENIQKLIAECLGDIAIFDPNTTETVYFDPPGWVHLVSFAWSYDYRYLAYSDGYDINVYDIRNGTVTNLTGNESARLEYSSKWSPIDYKIALTSYINNDANPSLWVYDLTGRNSFEISDNFTRSYTWSPKGDKILFSKSVDDSGSLGWYIYNIETNKAKLLTRTGVRHFSPDWSDDEKCVVFISQSDNTSDIFLMCNGGNEVTRLTDDVAFNKTAPKWILGDTTVTYTSVISDTWLVHLIDLRTNISLTLPPIQGAVNFDLSRDKTAFAYMTYDNKLCIFQFLGNRSDCSQGITYPGTMLAWSR